MPVRTLQCVLAAWSAPTSRRDSVIVVGERRNLLVVLQEPFSSVGRVCALPRACLVCAPCVETGHDACERLAGSGRVDECGCRFVWGKTFVWWDAAACPEDTADLSLPSHACAVALIPDDESTPSPALLLSQNLSRRCLVGGGARSRVPCLLRVNLLLLLLW